jgi:hypothetical protein
MQRRRRSAPHSFEKQIAARKSCLEARAASLPAGPERDDLLKTIKQLETAAHMSEWLTPPGLQPRNWAPVVTTNSLEKFICEAEECVREAEMALDLQDKVAWLRLAEDWLVLARGAKERKTDR